MEKNKNRLIPLTKEFMEDKKTHDKVWSYLQINSYLTNDKERIVYKKYITAEVIYKSIVRIIGNKKDISLHTVNNTLKLYKQLGMIQDGIREDKDGNKVEVYILSQNFNKYQLIPTKTLKYLVDTANDNVIKIYAYLLNKYEYKIKTQEHYNFTLKELCEAIGYTNRYENILMIKNILISLKNNGLINYANSYYKGGKTPIPIHILISVSTNYKC